ncbi:9302_t:CDS:1, partial [Acaulospora morrowiae]
KQGYVHKAILANGVINFKISVGRLITARYSFNCHWTVTSVFGEMFLTNAHFDITGHVYIKGFRVNLGVCRNNIIYVNPEDDHVDQL